MRGNNRNNKVVGAHGVRPINIDIYKGRTPCAPTKNLTLPQKTSRTKLSRGEGKILLLIGLLLIAFMLPFPVHAKIVERVIAVVNDDIITQSELDFILFNRERELVQMFKLDRQQAKERLQQEKHKLLDEMIRRHLLIQEARKKKLDISEDELNETINRIKKQQNIESDKEFENALLAEGYTLYSFREETKKKLMMEKLMAQEIGAKIEIVNSDIEKFYQENRDQFPDPDKTSLTDDEKAQIREFLFRKHLEEELDKYTSQLKEKAFIKITLDENPRER